jgi:soluble lytic murein transglycosylase-like protein
MERKRLVLLIACALLTTSLGSSFATPGGSNDLSDLTATREAVATTPSVLEAAPDPQSADPEPETIAAVVATNAKTLAEDDAIARQILARLSARHTALPARERLALARTVVREARAHNLEPDLVIAVIEVESAGYHLAVSHVGAMGLMQLLPSTAEELAGKHGIAWHGDDTLFDPTTNVKLGTAYLRQLADRYGDVSIALAAYNWGPGRIDRRLRRGATVPSRYIEQVMQAYDRSNRSLSRRS